MAIHLGPLMGPLLAVDRFIRNKNTYNIDSFLRLCVIIRWFFGRFGRNFHRLFGVLDFVVVWKAFRVVCIVCCTDFSSFIPSNFLHNHRLLLLLPWMLIVSFRSLICGIRTLTRPRRTYVKLTMNQQISNEKNCSIIIYWLIIHSLYSNYSVVGVSVPDGCVCLDCSCGGPVEMTTNEMLARRFTAVRPNPLDFYGFPIVRRIFMLVVGRFYR